MSDQPEGRTGLPPVWGPVAATALGVLVLALVRIAPYEYNWSALADIGVHMDDFRAHPVPPGTVLLHGKAGYDGYYYFRLALDPFFQRPGQRNVRAQRYLYPLAAYVLALGNPQWIASTLFAANLLAAVLGAWVVARMCVERGVSGWWSLCYSLSVGNLLAIAYDLTSPMCLALAVAAISLQCRRRIGWAALVYALALMTRESAVLVVGSAVLYEWLGRRWRTGAVLALSVVPLAVWQVVLTPIIGHTPWLASTHKTGVPLLGVYLTLRQVSWGGGVVALVRTGAPLVLFVLVMGATVVAARRLTRGISLFALGVCAQGLLAVLMGLAQWDSFLGATRILAGVFPMMVLLHAERPERASRWVLVAIACLSVTPLVRALWVSPVWPYEVTRWPY